MKIRILGGGWYGCHIARALLKQGHEVELHELADRLFSGASGGNPARLHLGPHYPRSKLTRALCQEHHRRFMASYGHLTRAVPINLYAIAESDSLVDFGNYVQTLKGEIEFVTLERPSEFGLESVEGAILTGERHIVIDDARAFFQRELEPILRFGMPSQDLDSTRWDWTIDCTFCANDGAGIQRYEPCVTGLLEGPTNKAVTIMDGPFPSIYPWNEDRGLCSLTSARYTPLARFATHAEAKHLLETISKAEVLQAANNMLAQIGAFWPDSRELFKVADLKLSIRAMPRSGADARLVDIVRTGDRTLRVRAGKIDAVLHAEQLLGEWIR
jgi:hypothetical protein